MNSKTGSRFVARQGTGTADLDAALALRSLAFRRTGDGFDGDGFDATAIHILIEEVSTGRLVCCFRLMPFRNGTRIGDSYSAQHYDLSGLTGFKGSMMEMGRFCIHPDCRDPDILRLAWGTMSRLVGQSGTEMLFGCSSFKGTEAAAYIDAFALLAQNHLAPKHWLPKIKAPSVVRFARKLRTRAPDMTRALRGMPPLLRSYLTMGGWVSDHAVVDRDLNTLHVFTGLEIRAIPPSRVRLMRAIAG